MARWLSLSLILLAACASGPGASARSAAPAPLSPLEPPEAWADDPTPEPAPLEVRVDPLLVGELSQLSRRAPAHDGYTHQITYTARLACTAQRSTDGLRVRVGPPDGRLWDLVGLHVFREDGELRADATASWHQNVEPSSGAWTELEGGLRISNDHPFDPGALRGDFELSGLMQGRPTQLVGRFVINDDGRCHARQDGSFRSNTLPPRE